MESFDSGLVPDTTLDDLSPEAIADYRVARREANPDAEELRWSDEELLQALGKQVGTGLENLRHYAELRASSERALILNRLTATLAAQHKLPAMSSNRNFVIAGGLMSYGPDRVDAHHGHN